MDDDQACAACWQRKKTSLFPDEPTPNLDTEDSESVELCVTTADNDLKITYSGLGNTQNASLMDPLNRWILAKFAASLRVQDVALEIMEKALSAGAWLHMFIRVRITGQVKVSLNGEAVDTVQQLWVGSHFRALALSRIGELVCAVMAAIRLAQGVAQDAKERGGAHAAAVILRHEISTFKRAPLLDCTLVPLATQQLLLQWLDDVTDELQTLICQACGEFKSWSSVILDPVKTFRVFRQPGQSTVMTLTVSRKKRTVNEKDQQLMSPVELCPSMEVNSPATIMDDDASPTPNQFDRNFFFPLRNSPPSPTDTIHPKSFSPLIKDPNQLFPFPTSPPRTTTIRTPSVSDWALLSNGCVNPTWLSIDSNCVPSFYPGDIFPEPVSRTYDVEVNMEHSRSYSSFNNHLAMTREDEMDLDPEQYPPVVEEDNEDLYEFIDFHDDVPSP
ncbi:hypothetical protein ACMFMF_011128 [Clarireedia jacksonii]